MEERAHDPGVYYVGFESDADNLAVNAAWRTGEVNGRPDAYLYTVSATDDRSVSQAQGRPASRGRPDPSISYYANYILFDSPAPLGAQAGAHQVYLRYLGPV